MDKDKQGSNKFSDVLILALISFEICDLECKMSHVDIVYQGIQSLLSELVGMIRIIYSQTCVKRPYTTIHSLGFLDRWLKVVQTAQLLFIIKQPHVSSNYHVI